MEVRLVVMFAKTLESIQSSGSRQRIYARWIIAALAICIAMKSAWFSRWGVLHVRNLVDFDVFHIAAQRVWIGDVDQAYQFAKLVGMQRESSGGFDSFMPWTYPPQFSLLLAPLALLPVGLAYLVFTTLTFSLFLMTLRSLAGRHFVLLLIILFPAIEITLACGQNGFLTASLIGLFCLYFEERPTWAGIALGCMIIKPHLAVAFAVYAILKRGWAVVIAAAAVVLASSALCTVIFGVAIWGALLQSVRDSALFLEQGYYPLYRMISFYAALRSIGFSGSAAFLGQGIIALLALGIVVISMRQRMRVRTGLGLTALVSVCISPYAYDYDFLIVGIGLSLLLPELQANARESERGIIYGAPMLVGVYGTLRGSWLGSNPDISGLDVISISGFVIVPLIALILIILRRQTTAQDTVKFGEEPVLASELSSAL